MFKPLAALAALGVIAACSAAANPNAETLVAPTPAATAPAGTLAGAPVEAAAPAEAPAPRTSTASRSVAMHVAPHVQAAALSCDVLTRPTANGILIAAIVNAANNAAGTYDLSIVQGGANSAEIQQSGDFNAAAGSTVTLGQTEIGTDGASRGHARLRVHDNAGGTCSRTVRL